jgi:hypothetical protein
MKTVEFLLTAFLSLHANAQNWQFADIGFPGSDDYIGIELSGKLQNQIYRFGLCSTTRNQCVPLNSCSYQEGLLFGAADSLKDAHAHAQFLRRQDGDADGKIEEVFPQIRQMLMHALPACPVPNLPELRGRLHPQPG